MLRFLFKRANLLPRPIALRDCHGAQAINPLILCFDYFTKLRLGFTLLYHHAYDRSRMRNAPSICSCAPAPRSMSLTTMPMMNMGIVLMHVVSTFALLMTVVQRRNIPSSELKGLTRLVAIMWRKKRIRLDALRRRVLTR